MTNSVAAPPTVRPAVADLLLVRMALPNPTPKKVREDVGKLLESELSLMEFDDLRSELCSAGFLTKGKRNTFALTDAGRERVLQWLGLTEIPPRANWFKVIATRLFPMAARLSPVEAARLKTGDNLSAFMLKCKYDLPASTALSVNKVLEALACKELGFPGETTLNGLMCAVVSQRMGSNRLDAKKLADQLPLFETGLTDKKPDTVRRRVVREWLRGSESRSQPTQVESFDLAAFASTVLKLAADSPPEDRFHGNKVFIAPLWRSSQREPAVPRLNLDQFKQKLIAANSLHLIHLSRADLVQVMDPRVVADSETTHLNATFHFVLLKEAHP